MADCSLFYYLKKSSIFSFLPSFHDFGSLGYNYQRKIHLASESATSWISVINSSLILGWWILGAPCLPLILWSISHTFEMEVLEFSLDAKLRQHRHIFVWHARWDHIEIYDSLLWLPPYSEVYMGSSAVSNWEGTWTQESPHAIHLATVSGFVCLSDLSTYAR